MSARPPSRLHVRTLQPVKGEIGRATGAMHVRDLIGVLTRYFRDQFPQRRIGFTAAAVGVLDDRARPETGFRNMKRSG